MRTTNLKRMINPKDQVIQLFEKAVEGEEHLNVAPKINVSSIYELCKEAHRDDYDGPFHMFFIESVLGTIFHECRHLFYECNEIS